MQKGKARIREPILRLVATRPAATTGLLELAPLGANEGLDAGVRNTWRRRRAVSSSGALEGGKRGGDVRGPKSAW